MNLVTDIFLPLALAFIMFALGLGLTGADFLRVIKQPKDFFVGAISQIILLPVIAFILVKIWPISPELAIGVMIIAAAPGGVTSNILTSFARGDVALSISLTAIISLLSVITVPFIIVTSIRFLGSDSLSLNISLTSIAINMFLIVTVPVIIGMVFRIVASFFASNAAIKIKQIAKMISIVLFIIFLLGAIFIDIDNIDFFYFLPLKVIYIIGPIFTAAAIFIGISLPAIFAPNASLKFEPIAKKISIVLFIIVLLGAILAEKDNIVSYFADAGLITLALNLIMMIVAFYVAQLLATGNAQKKCIAIECGLQNGTLAIFVGSTLFGGGAFVIPAATYSLIMFATSLIFVFLVKNN